MTDLRPYLVTAPLTINCADILDTNTIYVFDYNNSFIGESKRPDKMITYLESFGGMFDIIVDKNTLYEEKEQLLLRYFNAGSFFNVYTLTQTFIHIIFTHKHIEYYGTHSIFTDNEVLRFLDRNKLLINDLIHFYDSIFLIMLLYSTTNTKDMKAIKNRFNKEQYCTDELSPNICSLLLDNMFYTYYEKHISKELYYYTFLFDNNLYKSKSFIDILTNENNTLLPVLIDMNNEDFQNYIIKNKKES